MDYLTWAPLTFGFQVGLTNGRSWQKMRGGRREKWGVYYPFPPFLTVVLPMAVFVLLGSPLS